MYYEECQPKKRCYFCKGKNGYSLNYCDYCCKNNYCEINIEIKNIDRTFGLFFDFVIFILFSFFIKMMIDP